MLDAYIIEEIKRQEEARRRHEQGRPRLEIEIPRPDPRNDEDELPDETDETDEREPGNVIRIDL